MESLLCLFEFLEKEDFFPKFLGTGEDQTAGGCLVKQTQ